MPFWCALITNVVTPKSAKARCEGAAKAIKKELSNMDSKKVWDTGNICSLKDILRNPDLPEAMFGRVFSILGIKNKEFGDDEALESSLRVRRIQCLDEDWNFSRRPVRRDEQRARIFPAALPVSALRR